jgi:general secretion pathway protein K
MHHIFKIAKNNSGIALLLTVSVTTILVASALEYNRRARLTLVSTAGMRDSMTALQMASSGIHVAMAMLIKDKNESTTDTILEDWADSAKIDAILAETPFDEGKLSVRITDELGKIQINALVQFPDSRNFNNIQLNLWERFLSQIGDQEQMLEDSAPLAIINSIKDWLDSGDDDATTGLSGAETDYYQGLDPPYSSRNGPIRDVNELLLIKGVTPELFYGSPEKPGMSSYLSVHGLASAAGTSYTYPGRINLTTAELPVLSAVFPLESEDIVNALYEYRQEALKGEATHDFSDPAWYKEIPGFSDVNINPELITTSSDLFRIASQASINDTKMTTTAVIQRTRHEKTGKWYCKVLSWETE